MGVDNWISSHKRLLIKLINFFIYFEIFVLNVMHFNTLDMCCLRILWKFVKRSKLKCSDLDVLSLIMIRTILVDVLYVLDV